MAKYRALVDIPPFVIAGMIVEANAPLVPEFQKKLEAVSEGEVDIPVAEDPVNPDTPVEGEVAEPVVKEFVANPDRNELKEEATNLGVTFASNIPTDKLLALVVEAREAKKLKEEEEASKGEKDEGEEGEGEEGEE